METIRLRDGFYWVGIIDGKLRVFDIIMYMEFGTTYSSYVMKTGNKVVLFETVKAGFSNEYLEKLRAVTGATKIDYLVTNHTKPDYTGSVERLLDYSSQMEILATSCAISFLKEIVNRDFVSIAVKDNQRITIGKRTLHFMLVPNLRWSDTMYTFIKGGQILIACDPFGSHYCLEEMASDKTQSEDDYLKTLCYYFDYIIRPYRPSMLKVLDRVKSLDISMVYTGYDLMLTSDRIKWVMALYREWSTVVSLDGKKTVITPYVNAYGYIGLLVEKIVKGISDSSDIDVRRCDMMTADMARVQEELQLTDEMLFGTPTIIAGTLRPIWDLTLGMFGVTHDGKYARTPGSYGWNGEGVPHVTERLKQLKTEVVDGFGVRFKPSEADLVSVYEFGYQFGYLAQSRKPGAAAAKGNRKPVKCLVCGEISDSSIEICPICGVGRGNSIPVDDVVNDFTSNTANEYLILGNGAVGFNAAKATREGDAIGRITMVSEEPYPSYNRPIPTESLVVGLELEQIAMVGTAWCEENRVRQMFGKQVESVGMSAREALLDDETELHFTRLIYVLGSECFIPPIGGSRLPEMAAIRRLSGVKKMETLMKNAGKAVVIGGGVLELEAVWELKKIGFEVTVFKMTPSLMRRRPDGSSGKQLKIIAPKAGMVVRTGIDVKTIEGEGHMSDARPEAGGAVEAGMVIVLAGIRASIGLAKNMELETKEGAVVSELMEIFVSGIYACGDYAQYYDMNYGIWSEAVRQGRTAGVSVVGDSLEYTPVLTALTFHGMSTALFVAGDNGGNPGPCYRTVEFRDMDREQYRKYYFPDSRMSGVIPLGDLSRMIVMAEALKDHAAYQDLVKS